MIDPTPAGGRFATLRPAHLPLAALLAAMVSGAAARLPAQGGLRFIDPTVQPTLHVREHADRAWSLCFDTWSMAAGVPFLGGQQAGGVGVDPGARTVTTSSADVLKGGSGGNAFAAMFPFARDPRVLPIFQPQMPGLDRFGFLAPIHGIPPEAGLASVCFRIDLAAPRPTSVLLPMFANTRMGMATADAQGNATGRVFVVAPGRVQLARVLYYQFDRGDGTDEVNLAGIEGGALALATLQRSMGSPWTTGRFGFGLRAGTTLDSGFQGDLGARFTAAWFMRGTSRPTGVSPIFALDKWRVFTGGPAGPGLRCAGHDGSMANLDLPVDVQALSAAGWVHIALVADGDAGQATWYVNGNPRTPIPLTATVNIPPSTSTLEIGSSQGMANVYDLDEFRLTAAAESPMTIAQWAARSSAVGVEFTDACGANLRHSGMPALGSLLTYRIEAVPGSAAALTLGVGTLLGSQPLPLDLGLFDTALGGCMWYSDFSFTFPVAMVPSGGILTLPLNIPNLPALAGAELYAQALVKETFGFSATNAHLISIE